MSDKKTYTFSYEDTTAILVIISQMETLLKEATFKDMEYKVINALMKMERDKEVIKQKIKSKMNEGISVVQSKPEKKKKGRK